MDEWIYKEIIKITLGETHKSLLFIVDTKQQQTWWYENFLQYLRKEKLSINLWETNSGRHRIYFMNGSVIRFMLDRETDYCGTSADVAILYGKDTKPNDLLYAVLAHSKDGRILKYSEEIYEL